MKIIQATGQTCNQFWIYSIYIADCIENNKKMMIWVPDITIADYDNLKKSEYISFPFYTETLIKYFGHKKYSKLLLNKYALNFSKFIINILPNQTFLVSDTSINKKNNLRKKHANTLRKIFAPNLNISEKVTQLFINKRKELDLIVGIHIRWGDYRSFNNGKYFYSLDEYVHLMTKVMKLFSDKKITFFIATNENIDMSCFSRFNHFSNVHATGTTDLIGLSNCDYICGPPSTFSAWASFYNQVPLYFIENIAAPINHDSFEFIEEKWL